MKSRKFAILAASVAMVAAILACNAVPLQATVSNIRMTTDETGKTTTSTYAPGDAFYVFADLSGLSQGQVIEARWYAVNTQGLDPNAELNTSDYKYQPGIGYIYFQLTTTDGSAWPTGSYKVEVYLDGSKVGETGFTVQ